MSFTKEQKQTIEKIAINYLNRFLAETKSKIAEYETLRNQEFSKLPLETLLALVMVNGSLDTVTKQKVLWLLTNRGIDGPCYG